MTLLLALLLAQADRVRICDKTNPALCASVDSSGHLVVTGSLSVSGTADLPGTATFNANNVCASVITAGEQSVGFHLTAGTLDATLTPYITNQTGAINCATAGTCTASAFSSGNTIVVTNPSAVKDVGVNVVGGVRQVQVCSTTFASGSAAGAVTATFLQAASSGGGGGGSVTQGTSPWVVSAAALPLPSNAAKETGGNLDSLVAKDFATQTTLALIKAKTDNLDVALSTRTKPADSQTVTGTVAATQSGAPWTEDLIHINGTTILTGNGVTGAGSPRVTIASDQTAFTVNAAQSGTWNINNISGTISLPTGAAQEHTAAASPFSVRISTGAVFVDPTQIRALTVADIVTVAQGAAGASAWLVTGTGGTFPVTGTFWQATQPVSGSVSATLLAGTAMAGSFMLADGAYGVNELAVKGSGQRALASDPSAVVQLSPNSAPLSLTLALPQGLGPKGSISILSKVQEVDEAGRTPSIKPAFQPAAASDRPFVVAQSPVPAPICTSNTAVSQTASTRLVIGQTGKRIYICSIFVVSSTAQSISLIEGSGTTCGTLGTALQGSTTVANGMGLAANGGWTQASPGPFMVSQVNGDDICLLQSGAGNVAGSISYVQF